jgi:hypothetical protein
VRLEKSLTIVLALLLVLSPVVFAQDETGVVDSTDTLSADVSGIEVEPQVQVNDVPTQDPDVSTYEPLPGDETVEGNGGIGPGHLFYGLDKALDRLRLNLTFNKKERAIQALSVSRERRLEAKAAAEAGNVDAVEVALAEAEAMEEETGTVLDTVPVEDATETDGSEAEDVADLDQALADSEFEKSVVIQRIREFLANHPNIKATVLERLNNRLDRFQDHAKLKLRKEALKARWKKVLQAKRQLTDEELEDHLESVKEHRNLAKAKVLQKLKVDRAKAMRMLAKKRLQQLKDRDLEGEFTGYLNSSEEVIGSLEGEVSDLDETTAVGETADEAGRLAEAVNRRVRHLLVLNRDCRDATGAEAVACDERKVLAKDKFREHVRERHVRVLEHVVERIPETGREGLTIAVDHARERLQNLDVKKFGDRVRDRASKALEKRSVLVDRRARRIERAGDRVERRGDRVNDRLDRVSDRADNLGRERVADNLDRASDRVDRVTDRIEDRTDLISDRLEDRSDRLDTTSDRLGASGNDGPPTTVPR